MMKKTLITFMFMAMVFASIPAKASAIASNTEGDLPPMDTTESVLTPEAPITDITHLSENSESNTEVPPFDDTDLSEETKMPTSDTTDLSNENPESVPPADNTDLSTPQPSTPVDTNQGGGSSSPVTPGSQTAVSGTSFGFSTGSSFTSGLPTGQSVLGAATGPATGATCKAVITKYMKLGDRDVEVAKLQVVLNALMGKKLAITGVYDQATYDAVVEFQTKHSDLVLQPWVDAGLMDTEEATGYAYITTVHTINTMLCGGNFGPMPALR